MVRGATARDAAHAPKGDRVIVLANREPCIHQRRPSGEIVVQHPASGLVTALEPVMRACSGVWVAHGSGSADRESSDARGRLEVSTGDASYLLRRVWLNEQEESRLLLRLRERGAVAALPPGARASGLPAQRLAAVSARQSALRRRRRRRSRLRRSDRPRAGLSLRARPAHVAASLSPRDDSDLLAHSVAQRRTLLDLSVSGRDPRRAARQQHRRIPDAAVLPQLSRERRPHARSAHRAAGTRRRAPAADDAGSPVSDLDRMAGAMERDAARRGDVPRARCARSCRCRPTPSLSSPSIAWTTPKAWRSGC